jgi:beta-galactosidase GanA
LQQPLGLLSAGLTALDLQRLAGVLHAMSRSKAQVAVLYSQPARVFNHDRYIENLKAIHESLRWSGLPVDVLHENKLIQSKIDNIKLIIMPSSAWISEQTHQALKKFAADGGQVICVDPDANWKEPYGKTLEALSGPHFKTVSIQNMDENALFLACNDWLKQAGITPELVMNTPVRGLSHRAITVNGTAWVYLNNTTDEEYAVTLTYHDQKVQGMDRIAQQPVSSKIELAPHQIRVIQISE